VVRIMGELDVWLGFGKKVPLAWLPPLVTYIIYNPRQFVT